METLQWTPGRMLQTSGAYWEACALHGAVVLDLFTRIGNDSADGKMLAAKLNAPADGVARLLDAVCAMGLLVKRDGRFANTDASRTYLCSDSEHYIGYMIKHHHYLVESWARLPQSVLENRPVRLPVREKDEDAREAFLMGMFNLASQLAPKLVPAVDLSRCHTLLDLGGGPGTYAIHFCSHYPNLTATVMDLPTTRPFAEKTIRKMGMQDRISFLAGDFKIDSLTGPFDAIYMSHILHGESPTDCQRIVDRAVQCLNPGGVIVIHEFILEDTKDGPLFPALFSLNMLLGTEKGRAYSQAELFAMLEASGLVDCQRLDFIGTNDSGLVQGVKPE